MLTRLGSYAIERGVGRGGMGIVYLGHDPRLKRPVAIKVLPDAAPDGQRFLVPLPAEKTAPGISIAVNWRAGREE